MLLDWIGAHGNLVKMSGLWRVFVSVIVASQPGKYISESPGMGSMESKIVQRLCIWTNSLLIILEFPGLEKIHLTRASNLRVDMDPPETCPGEFLQQWVGSRSLSFRQLRLYLTLRSLGGGFLCEHYPKSVPGFGWGRMGIL